MDESVLNKKDLVDSACKSLADRGKLIEAGWLAMRSMSIPENAPAIQIKEMRNAFFAGAQHLFGSIMSLLEAGEEATESDLRRIGLINKELEVFIEEYKAEALKAGGSV